MNRREGTKDRINKNHLLANFVSNGFSLPMVFSSVTTNSTSYAVVSNIILDTDRIKKRKLKDIILYARSGPVGASGMSVQLYDNTNNASMGVISFTGTQDQTIKTTSLKSYCETISGGTIFATIRIKKDGATGPSTLRSVMLVIAGKLSGTVVGE